MVTLDQYVSKNKVKADLLKVDVEGYDGRVYEGAEKFIATQKPTLFAEYAPLALKKAGYEPKRFLDNIVDKYDVCYIFNEKQNKLEPITKAELLKKDNSVVENILLTSNKKHIEILKSL